MSASSRSWASRRRLSSGPGAPSPCVSRVSKRMALAGAGGFMGLSGGCDRRAGVERAIGLALDEEATLANDPEPPTEDGLLAAFLRVRDDERDVERFREDRFVDMRIEGAEKVGRDGAN